MGKSKKKHNWKARLQPEVEVKRDKQTEVSDIRGSSNCEVTHVQKSKSSTAYEYVPSQTIIYQSYRLTETSILRSGE